MAPKKNSILTEKMVRTIIKEEVSNLPTIQEVEALVSHLPTKDYFDERMDALMKEVKDMREEQTMHQGQHDEVVERLDRLEDKVGLEPLF